jgi:arylsulfatase
MPVCSALVRKLFKYVYWLEFKYEQLFDLEKDPFEVEDIVNNTQYSKMLESMQNWHSLLEQSVL